MRDQKKAFQFAADIGTLRVLGTGEVNLAARMEREFKKANTGHLEELGHGVEYFRFEAYRNDVSIQFCPERILAPAIPPDPGDPALETVQPVVGGAWLGPTQMLA